MQTAFDQQSLLKHGGETEHGTSGRGMSMTHEQFADTVALSFRDEALRHNSGALTFDVRRVDRPDGTHEVLVSARDRAGSGVDIAVLPDSSVRVVPYEGLDHGQSVRMTAYETSYRLNPDRTGGMPYVEQSPVTSGGQYVPLFTPGDDRPGESRTVNVRNTFDNPGQTVAGNPFQQRSYESTFPATVTLVEGKARSGSDLFVVRDGVPQALRNGYQQSGHITYNGAAMVEQSTGRGTVLYDKTQLEAHARDPKALDRELERGAAPGGSATIHMSGGHVLDGLTRTAERAQMQAYEPPTLQR